MKIFQLKEADQMIMKIGYCMTQVFLGAKGKDIYRDCDSYDRRSNPLLPKITLNKVRVFIVPEARSWLKIRVEDQRGEIKPRIGSGSLDFTSPGRIRLVVSNLEKKTEQEMAVQWSGKDGIQYSDFFQGPEKSTDTNKQVLSSPIQIPEEIIEKNNKRNGNRKNNNRTEKKPEEPRNFRKPNNSRMNKLNLQGMSSKDFASPQV